MKMSHKKVEIPKLNLDFQTKSYKYQRPILAQNQDIFGDESENIQIFVD